MLARVVKTLGPTVAWQEIDVLQQLEHAAALGVMATPSIAINGKVVITGAPKEAELYNVLKAHVDRPASRSPAARRSR